MTSLIWTLAAKVEPRCCTRRALWPFGPPETTEMSWAPVPLLDSQLLGLCPPSVTAVVEVPAAVSQLLSKSTPPEAALAGISTLGIATRTAKRRSRQMRLTSERSPENTMALRCAEDPDVLGEPRSPFLR